jgi:hypothetical protein
MKGPLRRRIAASHRSSWCSVLATRPAGTEHVAACLGGVPWSSLKPSASSSGMWG